MLHVPCSKAELQLSPDLAEQEALSLLSGYLSELLNKPVERYVVNRSVTGRGDNWEDMGESEFLSH